MLKASQAPEGLSTLLASSIKDCEVDLRSDLKSTIVLAGGGSLLRGLDKRLVEDDEALTVQSSKRLFANITGA